MTDALKPIAAWIKGAMRFIDLCEADVLDYLDRDLTKDAARLTKEGYELFGVDPEGSSLADLEHAELPASPAIRAPLAPAAITDDLVARGVTGIQRRDAEGWSDDQDEDQINRELARAVLVGVLEPLAPFAGVKMINDQVAPGLAEIRRYGAPEGPNDGHGAIMVGDAMYAAIEDAIAREEAARAARLSKMPTDLDAIGQINEALRRLKDLGWKDAIYCPKDGSPFDGIDAGSSAIHTYIYLGEWPTGTYMVMCDGDYWASQPILFRLKSPAADADATSTVQP
jgi:hypothetical protein